MVSGRESAGPGGQTGSPSGFWLFYTNIWNHSHIMSSVNPGPHAPTPELTVQTGRQRTIVISVAGMMIEVGRAEGSYTWKASGRRDASREDWKVNERRTCKIERAKWTKGQPHIKNHSSDIYSISQYIVVYIKYVYGSSVLFYFAREGNNNMKNSRRKFWSDRQREVGHASLWMSSFTKSVHRLGIVSWILRRVRSWTIQG